MSTSSQLKVRQKPESFDFNAWWNAWPWPSPENYREEIAPLIARGEPLPHLPSECARKAIEEAAMNDLMFDVKNFELLGSRAGRDHRPGLLWTAWRMGVIRKNVVRASVGPAWGMAESPDLLLRWSDWKELFHVAGYTKDGQPAERPTEGLQLYRAAPVGRHFGHSWTEDIEVARWFVDYNRRRNLNSGLWTASVRPSRLLARMEEIRPGEPTYVVDTNRLRVVRLDG